MKNIKIYIIALFFIILGLGSFTLFNIIGSEVLSDGTLKESFFLIPLGIISILLALLISLSKSIWALFHKPKKIDKIIFTITLIFFLALVFYFMASFAYLSEESEREIRMSTIENVKEIN